MRRYAQLSADEQTRAVQFQLDQLGIDPAIASDPTVAPKLTQFATQRARDAFYLDPGDRLVTLPPPPPPPPTP